MCAPSVFSYSVLCLSVCQSFSQSGLASSVSHALSSGGQSTMPYTILYIYWGDAERRCSLLQIIIITIFSFFPSLSLSISLCVFINCQRFIFYFSIIFSALLCIIFSFFFFWYCLCVFNLFFNYFCGWFFHWNRARLLSPCFLAELPVHQATVAGSVRGLCLCLRLWLRPSNTSYPSQQVSPIDQHFFFVCIFHFFSAITSDTAICLRIRNGEFQVDNSSH